MTCARRASAYGRAIVAAWRTSCASGAYHRACWRSQLPPTPIRLASVERSTNADGRVEKVNPLFGGIQVLVGSTPMRTAINERGFNVEDAAMARLWEYCEECLTKVVADKEMGALLEGLQGRYILPGPGGDPIRNPSVLPTGKNMHGLDPQSIPTIAACDCAKLVVDRLIERQKEQTGEYPTSVAFVLWGTDNIKTYGESLAQVLWMVGVRPLPDSLGRVNRIEPIPLEELGRPRIDVVVTCSGVFRDLFINQAKGRPHIARTENSFDCGRTSVCT